MYKIERCADITNGFGVFDITENTGASLRESTKRINLDRVLA